MRALKGLSLVALVLLTACSKPTEVELRLYPCGEPDRVDLDIQGYDGEGKPLPLLEKSFAISDPGVFGDMYATVGLNKPDGMVTADFTLTWHEGDALEVVVLTGKNVPDAGEVLELGADGCVPVGGTTTVMTEPTSSTGASTSTSTGPASTSTGDDTTGTTGTTGMMGTTSTTDSTSGGTTTMTGDTSTGGESSTGEDSMLDDMCPGQQNDLFCEHAGPGKVGTLLKCDGVWKLADPLDPDVCSLTLWCPMMETGFAAPEAVGCSGIDKNLACVCRDTPSAPCEPTDQGCAGNVITLCYDAGDGMGDRVTKAVCGDSCDETMADMPYCIQ